MSKDKESLEEGNHHPLSRALHDHAREQDHVIGRLGLGIRDCPPQGVGLEENVGVGEQQPVSGGLLAGRPHGVRLAEPARRQFRDVDDFQESMRLWAGDDIVHDLAGSVGRAVVHRDHFVVGIVEGEQTDERFPDVLFLVAGGNDDAGAGVALRSRGRAVPSRTRDVRHLRHAQGSVYDPREPGQRQYAARNPVKYLPGHSGGEDAPEVAGDSPAMRSAGANRMP